jgi:two-component system phosphate regulon response regulator PhoB
MLNLSILIVEDESPLVELLRYNIEQTGFDALIATDGETALLLASEEEPDLIILDWMLPDISGIEVCRRLRADKGSKAVPIIMLTAKGEEQDKVSGLEAGADDYIVKPFSPSELIARINAVLRRSNPNIGAAQLKYSDIVMDMNAHKVSRAEKSLHLGPTEYRLLQVLIERPTRVFSREQLLDHVWGRDIYVEERTVDVHIRRLRKALNKFGGDDLIRTVRRGGYAIDIEKN